LLNSSHSRVGAYYSTTLAPLVASGSNSSDYFDDEDPAFLSALGAAVLPGDLPANDDSDSEDIEPPPPGQVSLKRRYPEPEPVEEAIYGAARFGEFGEYMQRKRAKLQIQNSELSATTSSQIFKGVKVYVNTSYTVNRLQLSFVFSRSTA
jgi:DNA repair protein REV1